MDRVKKKNIPENAGFSLVELTFAAGVLALGLSMLFGSLLSLALVARLNEERAVANAHLASVLDQVRTKSVDDLMEYQPPALDTPGVQRAVTLVCFDANGESIPLPLESPAGSVLIRPALPDPFEVRATLLWSNARGQVFESSATTLVKQ